MDMSLRQADPSVPAAAATTTGVADQPLVGAGIYLDYAATTPVGPAVARVMSGYLTMDGTGRAIDLSDDVYTSADSTARTRKQRAAARLSRSGPT